MHVEWKHPRLGAQDRAWLAGLLEGEGCFSLQRYFSSKRTWYALPSIQIGMTDRDVVQRAGALLGGGQAHVRVQARQPPCKPMHIWRVNGRRAVHVMKQLLPYMGKRRSKRMHDLIRDYERNPGPEGSRGCRSYSEGEGDSPPKRLAYQLRKNRDAQRRHRARQRHSKSRG